jgi:hypothetical protein
VLDLIIRGGQVVTPQVVAEMDVGIQGEKLPLSVNRERLRQHQRV